MAHSTANLGTALITGASSGIGATYADRLARRGYDLILAARDEIRLTALAERLRAETGVNVRVQKADLTARDDLAAVERILREDAAITLLVNNAGMATKPGVAHADLDEQSRMIALNITALTRLTGAAVPGLLARGGGAIINIASVLAYGAEVTPGVYSASKAYVVTFSQGLQAELGGQGLYVQAVLPAATKTEIWDRSGLPSDQIPASAMMDVNDLVDAALVGFDRHELVTLPSLPDEGAWIQLEAARKALIGQVRNGVPAARYREAVAI